ncbi:MAG: hypothetical protein AB7F41_10115 [Methylocystis sp.]|uniref:bestrophin-like domain n=1 Tax=Methylocystis sp. TaxID=1911079 RepID=UPI003D0E6B85
MEAFIDYPLSVIFLTSLILLVGASEIGRRFGARSPEGAGASIATLEAAMLGLLALMLGFTFAMALSRFDARRDAILHEANAIGTAALRARLLPAPYGAESLRLFHDYVQIRLDLATRVPTPAELAAAIARSNRIQEGLWRQIKAASAKDNAMVPTGLYIQALNEMFDVQEIRLTAVRNHVPIVVVFSLYGIAMVALAFTGYASGIERRRPRFPVYLMSLLIAGVILLIQDIDRWGIGFVTVSQQPMIDTAKAINGYSADVQSEK